MIGNDDGVTFRDMLRSTPEVSIVNGRSVKGKNAPIWNHDEVVRHNVFLNNKRAQINFGIKGINANRQVPQRLLGSPVLVEQGKKRALDAETKLAEDYVDKKYGLLQPKGLYLEKLNFVINGNVYWGGDNVPLMQWGNLLIYRNLTDLRADRRLRERRCGAQSAIRRLEEPRPAHSRREPPAQDGLLSPRAGSPCKTRRHRKGIAS